MTSTDGDEKVDFSAMMDEALDSPTPEPTSTPEPTPPETPSEPASPPTETAEETAARLRDERGRFTRQPESPSEPTPPVATAPAASVPPATPPAATDGTSPDVSAYPPFEYAAGNRRLRVDGAVVDESGAAYFSKSAVPQLHRLLAQAHEAQALKSNQGRIRADAMREGQDMLQRGHHMVKRMDDIFGQGQVGSEQWENAVIQFALNWAREKPRLDAEARAQIAAERLKGFEAQAQERQAEESRSELLPKKYAAVDDWTQRLATQHGFSATDIAKLQQRYRSPQWFERLFEEENGEVQIVYEMIDRDLQELKQFGRPPVATVARPAAPPPPVAAARASAPPSPGKKPAPSSSEKKSVHQRTQDVLASVFD